MSRISSQQPLTPREVISSSSQLASSLPTAALSSPRREGISVIKEQDPRFAGIGGEAIQGLVTDTLGVLVPKLIVSRGSLNRKEEWALELLEDVAFYFAVPFAGEYLFSNLFKKILGRLGVTKISKTTLGKWFEGLTNNLKNRYITGAKAGTLLAAIAVAAGLEYMVPHIKNVITAKVYNTKNFTAVANLEKSRSTLKSGESDPVKKAKQRILPVALAVAGAVGFACLLPLLAAKNIKFYKGAEFFAKYFDFGKSAPLKPLSIKNGWLRSKGVEIFTRFVKTGTMFDMSKPILAILALTGLGGYLDAARDKLEIKELATRVALFVIPYYIFGKELAGNLLARIFDKQLISKGIKDISFIVPNPEKSSFLDFNKVISEKNLKTLLKEKPLSKKMESLVMKRFNMIWWGKFILSALVVGVLANIVSFRQTRHRYQQEEEKAAKLAALELIHKRYFDKKPAFQRNESMFRQTSHCGYPHWGGGFVPLSNSSNYNCYNSWPYSPYYNGY